jgi:hypothetical protein
LSRLPSSSTASALAILKRRVASAASNRRE